MLQPSLLNFLQMKGKRFIISYICLKQKERKGKVNGIIRESN